jgi:ubiquinone/menaquinone biosynthesis C-methylase UbiE
MVAARAKDLRVVGLDESRWMGVMAIKGLVGVSGDNCVVNGYAQFLPFSDSSFDQVVSTFPPEFILDHRTLSESKRVLVDDGELIILPTAWITGAGWYDRLTAWLFHVTGQAPEWDVRFTKPIAEAGFQVNVEIQERKSDRLLIIRAKKA